MFVFLDKCRREKTWLRYSAGTSRKTHQNNITCNRGKSPRFSIIFTIHFGVPLFLETSTYPNIADFSGTHSKFRLRPKFRLRISSTLGFMNSSANGACKILDGRHLYTSWMVFVRFFCKPVSDNWQLPWKQKLVTFPYFAYNFFGLRWLKSSLSYWKVSCLEVAWAWNFSCCKSKVWVISKVAVIAKHMYVYIYISGQMK